MNTNPDHTTRIVVRGYELDAYGHVNNAVYLNYFEHARWEMLRSMNLSSSLHSGDLFLVVTDVHIRYTREAKLYDEIEIQTRVSREEPFLIFKQRLINISTGLSLARGETKTIFIDKNRTPVDIPGSFTIFPNNSYGKK